MPALVITEQYFDDVVVLHLRGRVSIGEGSVTVRRAVRDLLEKGQKQFVLNFAGVGYVDSSGNGEMVSAYTAINKAGGKIVFCHLSQKIQDLWTIGKLLTVFDVYDDVVSAVAAMGIPQKFFRCPLSGCNARVTVVQSPTSDLWTSCGACEGEFKLTLTPGNFAELTDGVIGSFRIPTYSEEYVHTTIGWPSVIEIVGRLDLFASDILRKAWQAVPAPRGVIFDITPATEISQRGYEAMYEFYSSDEVDSRVVIVSGSSRLPDQFSMPVYQKRDAALAEFAPTDKQTFHPLLVHLLREG